MRGSPSRSQTLAATMSACVEFEPARDADHHVRAARGFEAAAQAFHLDVEGLIAVLVEMRPAVRDIGKAADRTDQADVREARPMLEEHVAEGRRGDPDLLGHVVEGLHPHTLAENATGVDVGDADLRLQRKTLRFGQEVAELVDHPLAIPGEVGGALAGAGGRVGVGGGGARRLRATKHVALVGLADGDVRGREVREDRGACQRARRRRRDGGPEVLADLHVEDEAVEVARVEDQVAPERYLLAAHPDRLPEDVAAVGEPALLVVLPVVGQEALRDDAEQPAASDGQGAVVEATRMPQRCTDQEDRRQIGGRRGDVTDGGLRRVEERGLQVEVVDGVGGDTEFGKDRQVHPCRVRAPGFLENGVAIVADIRRPHARCACRYPDEAMPMHGHEVFAAIVVVHACLAHSAFDAP